ncbi:hypothetical protein KIN20_023582 [Parelaphostrongylus tenuis]|uniref:Uncharacterized protein n=1 Tax=Parelaphostrongylus tenuis TaxID=148309 RepID=A0AAD5MVT8_PARTN|nr:hypothetical protein KIN20_023582 [Parelaphostrongylus tenuis]
MSTQPLLSILPGHDILRIHFKQWSSLMKEIGLDNALGEAVFRNASRSQKFATLPSLTLQMLLVGLEYFSHGMNEKIESLIDAKAARHSLGQQVIQELLVYQLADLS